MRASDFITEDLTRRDLLKGAGAAAIGATLPKAQAGEFQKWNSWQDPKTVATWEKRWQQLSSRAQRVYTKLKSMLPPAHQKQIAKVQLEVGETRASGLWKDGIITIDLSIFWDLSDSALAYTIAHEMGHAFYNHGGYDNQSPEQNKKNELLADAFGAKIAYKAGYDPSQCFGDMTRKEKAASVGDKTHPGYQERLKYIKQETGITVSHIKRGVDLIGVPMSQIAQA